MNNQEEIEQILSHLQPGTLCYDEYDPYSLDCTSKTIRQIISTNLQVNEFHYREIQIRYRLVHLTKNKLNDNHDSLMIVINENKFSIVDFNEHIKDRLEFWSMKPANVITHEQLVELALRYS